MVVMVRAFLLLCSIPLLMTSAHDTVRCSRDAIVSSNRVLLSLDNIAALHRANELPQYPLRDIVSTVSNRFWCASSTAGPNYVNMTFTQPVVVKGIFSGGAVNADQTRLHYVSNFSILFSQDVNGQLQLYHRQFTAMSPAVVYYIGESITAQKLQFQINEYGPDALFCWNIRLLGCTTENAEEIPAPPAVTTFACPTSTTDCTCAATSREQLSSTQTQTSMPVSNTPFVTMQSVIPIAAQQNTVTVALLGAGAAMLVVGVVLIVVAAAFLCGIIAWTKRTSSTVKSRPSTHEQDNGGFSSMRKGITERTTSTAVTNENYESETIQNKDLKEVTACDYVMDIPTPCLPNKEDQTAQGYIPLEINPSYSTSKAASASQDYEVPVATNSAHAHNAPTTPH